jgi:putative oxidoreductase
MAPSSNKDNLGLLISRLAMVVLFVPYGIEKVTDFAGTVRYITDAHAPFPELAAIIAIVFELGLMILLLIGYQTRWVALATVVYLVVLSFIFHPYWAVSASRMYDEKLHFYKDLAIAGGLLAIVVAGPGAWSVDGWRSKAKA